jgi:tetratricopeptide (TPR) repeat protein
MKTGPYIEVGVAAFALALATTPAAHAGESAPGEGARGAGANAAIGRYAEALADYDALIQRSPRDPAGYQARGRLNLILGKAGAAAADLRQAVRLKPNDPYNVLWLHYARNKESAPDAMELEVNAERADRAAWPGPLLDAMTGKIDAAAALAKAGEGKAQESKAQESKVRAAQLCEAELFLGQDDLAAGRRSQGLDRLKAAARDCAAASREAQLARADLPGGAVPRLAQAFSSRPPVPVAEPNVRPAWVRSGPQAPVQVPLQTALQAQPLPGDPLMLRGSLR